MPAEQSSIGKTSSMDQETYRNAPITEAALDIRVALPEGVGIQALERIRDDGYPVLHQRPVKIEFKVTPPQEPSSEVTSTSGEVSNTPLGFAYRSPDAKQVFQVRTDGFTHNRLAPYQDWKTFSQEARRLWPKYAKGAAPKAIELLGLHYINQILVPNNSPFEEYVRTFISIPNELPQMVNTYNLGFQINWPGLDGVLAFVGVALGPPMKAEFATIVLSIQAFKNLARAADQLGEDEIWQTFETLRSVKNKIFEACITDHVRREIR